MVVHFDCCSAFRTSFGMYCLLFRFFRQKIYTVLGKFESGLRDGLGGVDFLGDLTKPLL